MVAPLPLFGFRSYADKEFVPLRILRCEVVVTFLTNGSFLIRDMYCRYLVLIRRRQLDSVSLLAFQVGEKGVFNQYLYVQDFLRRD